MAALDTDGWDGQARAVPSPAKEKQRARKRQKKGKGKKAGPVFGPPRLAVGGIGKEKSVLAAFGMVADVLRYFAPKSACPYILKRKFNGSAHYFHEITQEERDLLDPRKERPAGDLTAEELATAAHKKVEPHESFLVAQQLAGVFGVGVHSDYGDFATGVLGLPDVKGVDARRALLQRYKEMTSTLMILVKALQRLSTAVASPAGGCAPSLFRNVWAAAVSAPGAALLRHPRRDPAGAEGGSLAGGLHSFPTPAGGARGGQAGVTDAVSASTRRARQGLTGNAPASNLQPLAPTKAQVKELCGAQALKGMKDGALGAGQRADPRPLQYVLKKLVQELTSDEIIFAAGQLLQLDTTLGRPIKGGDATDRMILYGRASLIDPACFVAPPAEEEEKREGAPPPTKGIHQYETKYLFAVKLNSDKVQDGIDNVVDEALTDMVKEEKAEGPLKEEKAKKKDGESDAEEDVEDSDGAELLDEDEEEVEDSDGEELLDEDEDEEELFPFTRKEKQTRRKVLFLLGIFAALAKDVSNLKFRRLFWRRLSNLAFLAVDGLSGGAAISPGRGFHPGGGFHPGRGFHPAAGVPDAMLQSLVYTRWFDPELKELDQTDEQSMYWALGETGMFPAGSRKVFSAFAADQTFVPPPGVTLWAETGKPGAVPDPCGSESSVTYTSKEVARNRILAYLDAFHSRTPDEEVPQMGETAGFELFSAFLEESYNFVAPPSCVHPRRAGGCRRRP